MDTVMFTGGGLLFVWLGFFLRRKHQQFMSRCITINGKIIDIVEKVNIRRNATGAINGKRTIQVPVIEYKYNKRYQFQSEVDANQHGIKKGEKVEVVIDPLKPKVAKLMLAAKDNTMLFWLMIGLGTFLSIIGLIQFNPKDFDIDLLANPFTIAVIIFSAIFFYLKVLPLLQMMAFADIYTENAKQMDEE